MSDTVTGTLSVGEMTELVRGCARKNDDGWMTICGTLPPLCAPLWAEVGAAVVTETERGSC
jgi:hypothetical protein